MTTKLCRHCCTRKANRPRGLCWRCYYSPGVRDRYGITSKFAVRGVRDYPGPSKLPQPTGALPATCEKVDEMEARAAQGLALFHPADATSGLK